MTIKINEILQRLGVPYEEYPIAYDFKGDELKEQLGLLSEIDGTSFPSTITKAAAFYIVARDLENKGFHLFAYRETEDKIKGAHFSPGK